MCAVKNNKVIIIVDDNVFLQHILGLILMLADAGARPSLLLSDDIQKELLAFRLLEAMGEKGEINIIGSEILAEKPEYFAVAVSQWGPPKTSGRKWTSVKRNCILHAMPIRAERHIAFPHGFEIKEQALSISVKARARALLFDCSFNPFTDYEMFYDKYLFESLFHAQRYIGYINSPTIGVVGLVTFNPYTIAKIYERFKRYELNVDSLCGRIMIMPKLLHVGSFCDLDFNNVDYVIPHPREFNEQVSFLEKEYPGVIILNELDFFKISQSVTVLDFGTSVSILSQLFGATVEYRCLLKSPPFFDPLTFDELVADNFFSCGHDSYNSYLNYTLSHFKGNKIE